MYIFLLVIFYYIMLISSRIFLEKLLLIHLARKLPVNGRQGRRILKKR